MSYMISSLPGTNGEEPPGCVLGWFLLFNSLLSPFLFLEEMKMIMCEITECLLNKDGCCTCRSRNNGECDHREGSEENE